MTRDELKKARDALIANHDTEHMTARAPIYREPEKPTVRACGMRSAVLVTYRPVAPRSSSSAEAMIAR